MSLLPSKNVLERQLSELVKEKEDLTKRNRDLEKKFEQLKIQNNRLLKMEAQHQNGKRSLLEKRIVFKRAEILLPESMVIGDRLENCTLKVYRGNNLTIADTAVLINCRIVGLSDYSESALINAKKTTGTIEIRGVFYNTHPRRFAISTHERVVIHKGVRFRGNVCASSIIISELTKVRGKFATRELWQQIRDREEFIRLRSTVLDKLRSNREMQVENSR